MSEQKVAGRSIARCGSKRRVERSLAGIMAREFRNSGYDKNGVQRCLKSVGLSLTKREFGALFVGA